MSLSVLPPLVLTVLLVAGHLELLTVYHEPVNLLGIAISLVKHRSPIMCIGRCYPLVVQMTRVILEGLTSHK